MWKLKLTFPTTKKCCACIIIYESISQRKRWGWVYARYWSNVEQLCEKWSRDATSGWRSGLANPGSRPPRSSGRPTAPAPYCTASEPLALFYRGNLDDVASYNCPDRESAIGKWMKQRERKRFRRPVPHVGGDRWNKERRRGKVRGVERVGPRIEGHGYSNKGEFCISPARALRSTATTAILSPSFAYTSRTANNLTHATEKIPRPPSLSRGRG